ncbi:MAG: hypothetical protein K2G19_13170, partial [Lachnospiraceae bacterium]|nr:hypothetical protein [Lachnospiraceae bacterium]
AVVSISAFCFQYSMGAMLPILLFVLIFFYLAGNFIQKKVTAFMDQILEEEAKEGEVIEKDIAGEGEEYMESKNAENGAEENI